MLVDSHCHLHLLDLSESQNSLEYYLDRAKSHQVEHMLCVCTELEDYPKLIELADKYSNVSISVGIHPNHMPQHVYAKEDILPKTHHPKLIAIGETGLDYFRCEGDLTWQKERFILHIDVAKLTRKPLIVHTRQASEDTLTILSHEKAHEIGGVMHCFTESWDIAKRAMDLNFYISFSGIVTFKNATTIHEVAKKIPLERMLIETDCPYLAPNPHRGKQNEPSYVSYVAECIATLRNESVEKIAKCTTANFYQLFDPKS